MNFDQYNLSSLEAFLIDLSTWEGDRMSEDDFSELEFQATKWFLARA